MITIDNLKNVLEHLNFKKDKDVYFKEFKEIDAFLKVDFKNQKLIYPTDQGFTISGDFTTSFTQKENFVVFECVHRLFEKGYKPNHIELEPKWTVGHGASGGRADIMIKDNSGKSLLIIECKTAGKEFDDEWKKTLINGGQILSYAKQAGSTQFVSLYASDLIDDKIIAKYYLVTLKDNERLLEELIDKEPLSYEKAKLLDKEDIYRAWKETYALDYSTKGLFENDIPAYDIGKTKYSINDLSTISSNDIQGKYHQFATILRQHNVSGRENAFDKLVNLFLCKIVDETNNPDELKFYWKGIAYDSFFELQDRLQKLYQEGMKRFLEEDVTYIDNEAIDKAFRFFKNDPDATKDTIKKYFRELKFFTNNDFAFIDVHNEKLFYQNAIVLLKIVQMLQDIQLKTEEENQFLGDMFEGFLDQGVKQSEGQFFTPMPIVKFILKSLPLEEIISNSEEIPKVIDYACGAGHFLNEYAKEIKPIILSKKDVKIESYFNEVVGVEKEYRLSKVAKVSAFMYGQDDINIVYGDALTNLPKIKDNDYSVLVANPPYSVKGFLETLTDTERKKYELLNSVGSKSYPNNNSIETFFIERAKQLIKPDGVAGIIVPMSILTKGKSKSTSSNKNIYVATREILIKYFDIVAISEFGSGTFGKTGTNTITLFLRRKKTEPAQAEHYLNRVDEWFRGDKTKDKIFKDEYLIKKYCNHLELTFKDYETLLNGNPSDELLKTEYFLQYSKEFDKWSEIKNLKKRKSFKDLEKEKKEAELKTRFVKYIVDNEKDKLYYFVLSSLNPQKVLIVKSPTKTKALKEFLGYEWSSAKGKEGIKYIGDFKVEKIEEENEDLDDTTNDDEGNVALEEEDKRVLSNLLNLDNINTPLYDPSDSLNEEKINFFIQNNFNGKEIEISEELSEFISYAKLENIIDFDKIDFNKSFSINGEKILIELESKFNYQKVESLLKPIKGFTTKIPKDDILETGKNPVITQETTRLISGYSNENKVINDLPIVIFGDHSCSFKYIDFEFLRGADGTQLMKFENEQMTKYFYHLSSSFRVTSQKYERHYKYLKELKIPVPDDKKIIDKIISECEEVDKKAKLASSKSDKLLKEINDLINPLFQDSKPVKLSTHIDLNIENINPKTEPSKEFTYVDIDSIIKGTGIINFDKKIIGRRAPSRARRLASKDSTIISTVRPYLKGFAYIDKEYKDTIFSTGFAILKSKDEKIILNKLVYSYFMFSNDLMRQMELAMPKASYPSINKDDIENFLIPIPDINIQLKILNEIEKREKEIIKSQLIVNSTDEEKQKILNKYL